MIGSFLSRVLLLVFGYVYPGYECYKVIEDVDSSREELKFWCQYWILIAMLTVCERIGDHIVSWLPLYGEAKIALVLFLWHPKTRGTVYVYGSFLRQYLANHEKEIDVNLQTLRNKSAKFTSMVLQQAVTYGQSWFFEIIQYVSSQSAALKLQPNPDWTDKGK